MKNYLRPSFIIFLGLMLLTAHAWAQEDNITTATSALQDVLSHLRASVQKLNSDNDQLTTRDNAMRQEVSQLQAQLGQLEAQGDLLSRQTDRLQEKNPRRTEEITDLEGKNSSLDGRIHKAQDGIKLTQKLLSPEPQAQTHVQKEELTLMKMIYESQERQESLHRSILDIQKNTPVLPAGSALAHQQSLKEQIKALEAQVAAYPPDKSSGDPGFDNHWDDAQLHQLEGELRSLEGNYSQLKDLMEQMSKKVQVSQLTVSQHVEQQKLQGSFDDLNHQGAELMADLQDLRSRMVDLDKRKSSLETMVQQQVH